MEEAKGQINICFRDKDLLERAFVHKSVLNEQRGVSESNERLEFLGDSVLEHIVREYLYLNYSYSEGDLTELRATIASSEALSWASRGIGLDKHLVLSRGEEQHGGRESQRILAGAFEALLAAVYLDQGYEVARSLTEKTLLAFLPEIIENQLFEGPKSKLQKLCQSGEVDSQGTPYYVVLDERRFQHNMEFLVEVRVNNQALGRGLGPNKQEAEESAARVALQRLTGVFPSRINWSGFDMPKLNLKVKEEKEMKTAEEILWEQLELLLKKEREAYEDRDLEALEKISGQQESIRGALQGSTTEASDILWGLLDSENFPARIGEEIEQRDATQIASLAETLLSWGKMLQGVQVGPKPTKVEEPETPERVSPPRKKALPHKLTFTDFQHAALWEIFDLGGTHHETVTDVARAAWPEEAADGKMKLLSRMVAARDGGLMKMEKVIEQGLVGQLPEREQEFYVQLQKKYPDKSSAQLRDYAFRFKRGRRKGPKRKVKEKPSTTMPSEAPTINFQTERTVEAIKASLLHPGGASFDAETLLERTSYTQGGLGAIMNGALRDLEEVLVYWKQGRELSTEARSVCELLEERYPNMTLKEIVESVWEPGNIQLETLSLLEEEGLVKVW